jgi:hypothetical protein
MGEPQPLLALRVALLTAPPFAGKTTLSRRIQQELGLPTLDCDKEVFCRGFRLLGSPDLGQAIKPLGAWKHLRKEGAFDELYAILHRDWFVTKGGPLTFVAVGWIYCFREWREQLRQAFAAVPTVQVELRLFVLRLSHDEFFTRYVKTQRERFGNGYGFFDKTPQEQRKQSDKHYDEFLSGELQLPSGAEMQLVQGPDEDILVSIKAFSTGTG